MDSSYVDVSVLPAYLLAALLICVAPGPDMAYMVAAGIGGGRPAAVRGALGVTIGVSVYVVIAAAGLGVVLKNHPHALTVLQLAGALYLARLAYVTARNPGSTHAYEGAEAAVGQNWFQRGLIVNLTNPKVLLFFLAFLPQFLGRSQHPALQLLMLGLLFQAVGLTIDLFVGYIAGGFRDKVLARPRLLRAMTLSSATVFAVLATIIGTEALTCIDR